MSDDKEVEIFNEIPPDGNRQEDDSFDNCLAINLTDYFIRDITTIKNSVCFDWNEPSSSGDRGAHDINKDINISDADKLDISDMFSGFNPSAMDWSLFLENFAADDFLPVDVANNIIDYLYDGKGDDTFFGATGPTSDSRDFFYDEAGDDQFESTYVEEVDFSLWCGLGGSGSNNDHMRLNGLDGHGCDWTLISKTSDTYPTKLFD